MERKDHIKNILTAEEGKLVLLETGIAFEKQEAKDLKNKEQKNEKLMRVDALEMEFKKKERYIEFLKNFA